MTTQEKGAKQQWDKLQSEKAFVRIPQSVWQFVDPLTHYITSVFGPWSLVLNKPVNPEALEALCWFITNVIN